MTTITVDLTEDSETLRAAVDAIGMELNRRAALDEARELADRANEIWGDATGREDGDEWVQPEGAHDAYRLGAIVAHGRREWESLRAGNNFEPGTDSTVWRELVPDGEPPAEWRQPQAHNPYMTGDRVTYQGAIFESLIDGNVHPPGVVPGAWGLIS